MASVSVEPVASAVTESGATPEEGLTLSAAVGATSGGWLVTVTVAVAAVEVSPAVRSR